jgi:addiction module HigA family antidote
MKKSLKVHPGKVLLEEYLTPRSLGQVKLAFEMKLPPIYINEIVKGLRDITEDTDKRLSEALGTCPGFWLGLQTKYNREV